MTDKLAEVREKIIKVCDPVCSYEGQCRVWDDYAYCPTCQADQILNTPIPIEGVCPECEGEGISSELTGSPMGLMHLEACPTCKGTGKLDKTITVREAIERVIG